MPQSARLNDICTGHSCYPPRPIIQGSPDVNVNGRPAARLGDKLDKHCCKDSCHAGNITSGSGTVFINGKPAARIGDSVSCGSRVLTASSNVNAGD